MFGIINNDSKFCLALNHLVIIGKYFLYVKALNGKFYKIFMFLIKPPNGNAKIQKLIAKHIFKCFEKRKGKDGKK